MEPVLSDMHIRFNRRLNELISWKGQNTQIFTKAEYSQMMKVVRQSKNNKGKSPADHQRLLRYDVTVVNGSERLVAPAKEGGGVRHYVHTEEIFQILHDAHIAIGHGGRNRMEKEISAKYKNITREMIVMFLGLCQICQKKQTAPRKSASKGSISKEMKSKGRVDLLEMDPVEGYRYMMVYQDQPTKFLQLRPLKSRGVEEVSSVLMDIFAAFGAPNILQAENAYEVTRMLTLRWPELRMAVGKLGPEEEYLRDVERALSSWQSENNTQQWPEGLRFVQVTQNKTHRVSLCCSPHEAMFGTKLRVGLRSWLLEDIVDCIETEQDLWRFFGCGHLEEVCDEAGIDMGSGVGPTMPAVGRADVRV